MTKKSNDGGRSVAFARYTTLVLVLINAYQPISLEQLKSAVGHKLSEEDLKECISYLTHEGLIKSLPKKEFRATWKGINSLWSKRLRLDRDIQRMSHLAEVARSGRNTTGR